MACFIQYQIEIYFQSFSAHFEDLKRNPNNAHERNCTAQ